MNPPKLEKSSTPSKLETPVFHGCVEILPPLNPTIQFIDHDQVWLFSRKIFLASSLVENPEQKKRKTLPPEILKLYFSGAEIIITGWRLQPVVEALLNGRLILVRAEKLLGNLVLDEPWVNAIQVREHFFRCPV